MSASPRVWVPTVRKQHDGPNAQVVVRSIAAGRHVPANACRTEVEDLHLLVMSAARLHLHERGELLLPAWVEGPATPPIAIEGRSCALGLALATLSVSEQAEPQRDVVATGCLGVAEPDLVLQVDYLEVKLTAVLRWIEAAESRRGALVLFPACQDPRRAAGDVLCPRSVAALKRSFEDLGCELRSVATLSEAANLALHTRGQPFGESRLLRLRSEIESLRYDYRHAAELFAKCKELAAAAARLTTAGIGAVARYHALIAARFAHGRVAWGGGPLGWPSWPGATASELCAHLEAKADALRRGYAAHLPPELLAEHYNFEAVGKGFGELAFSEALALVDRGLSVDGLVTGHYSERRKLLGTGVQMRWRLAMRLLAGGLRSGAAAQARRAVDDVTEALRLAEAAGVTDPNDRARVRVYLFAAVTALEVATGGDDGHGEEAARALEHVLGEFWRGAGPPQQEPGWGLRVLFRRMLNQGDFAHVVEHWRCATGLRFEGEPYPSPASRRLPYFVPIVRYVLEAAVRAGDRALAESLDADASAEGSPLAIITSLWPIAHASPDWRLDRTRRRLEEALRAPAPLTGAAAGEPLVATHLDALRRAFASSDFAAGDAHRHALLLWSGEPARAGGP